MQIINEPFDPFAALPDECRVALEQLIDELLRVNEQVNLTAVRERELAWIKHILDSLQALRFPIFGATARVIDVGSGAGFPGLPLAVARPLLSFSFLEATRKKCHFITDVSAQLAKQSTPNATMKNFAVQVLCARAEAIGQDKKYRARFDIATARAVGSLSEVGELCLPLVRVGGHVVLWRGMDAPEEIKQSQRALQMLGGEVKTIVAYELPRHDTKYHLVLLKKTRPTPHQFPRRDGLPKQNPL